MTPGRTWVNFMLPFKAVGRPEESRTPKPLSERQHLKLMCLPIPPQDDVLLKSKCRVRWAKLKCFRSRRIAQICKQKSASREGLQAAGLRYCSPKVWPESHGPDHEGLSSLRTLGAAAWTAAAGAASAAVTRPKSELKQLQLSRSYPRGAENCSGALSPGPPVRSTTSSVLYSLSEASSQSMLSNGFPSKVPFGVMQIRGAI